jgi:hypothetical protein
MRLLLATLIFAGTAWAESPNCTSTLVVPVCLGDTESRAKEAAKVFNETLNKTMRARNSNLSFNTQLGPSGAVTGHDHQLLRVGRSELALGVRATTSMIESFLDPEGKDEAFPVHIVFWHDSNNNHTMLIEKDGRVLDVSTGGTSPSNSYADFSEFLWRK